MSAGVLPGMRGVERHIRRMLLLWLCACWGDTHIVANAGRGDDLAGAGSFFDSG